ncbi:MAG: hypothetical protein ABR973_06215 [Candidatus Acidiferrales bacterium]
MPLATVHKLLESCAAGHTARNTTHAIKVTYNGKEYPTLPSFNNVEIGYIRSMVRALEISKECANRVIPNLFKIPKVDKGQQK